MRTNSSTLPEGAVVAQHGPFHGVFVSLEDGGVVRLERMITGAENPCDIIQAVVGGDETYGRERSRVGDNGVALHEWDGSLLSPEIHFFKNEFVLVMDVEISYAM